MVSVNLNYKTNLGKNIYHIGAFICHTPKTLNDTYEDGVLVDNRCTLVSSRDELIEYFGDPNISPSSYPELMLSERLVSSGTPVYISSVYDMQDHDDEFKIKYNGYTEISFKQYNENDYINAITLKLKSEIKFCQPLIYTSYSDNTLVITVLQYILDRDVLHINYNRNQLYPNMLYRQDEFTFNTLSDTDQSIINALSSLGIELKIEYTIGYHNLITLLKSYSSFIPVFKDNYDSDSYSLNLHDSDYTYFLDGDQSYLAYSDALSRLNNVELLPHNICLPKLYKTVDQKSSSGSEILYKKLKEQSPEYYSLIYSNLLDSFNKDSSTYLFINAPDVSVSTTLRWLKKLDEFSGVVELPSANNCDLYFGYISEYVSSNLKNPVIHRVSYSAALLVMYGLLINQSAIDSIYRPLGISNLGIAYKDPKLVTNEVVAKSLLECKCNSIVNFDSNTSWIYGNRSLSDHSALQHSHISRFTTYIRRVISEYLELNKFSLNTIANADAISTYIDASILSQFRDSGILNAYQTKYTKSNKSLFFKITLNFYNIFESIQLNFNIAQ